MKTNVLLMSGQFVRNFLIRFDQKRETLHHFSDRYTVFPSRTKKHVIKNFYIYEEIEGTSRNREQKRVVLQERKRHLVFCSFPDRRQNHCEMGSNYVGKIGSEKLGTFLVETALSRLSLIQTFDQKSCALVSGSERRRPVNIFFDLSAFHN